MKDDQMTQHHGEPVEDAVAEFPLLIVGCGNLLRGDDGVGPILIRHLWERGMPAGAQIVDGGTAGMDVAFRMRGARRVIMIDASRTGAPAGTIYRVPGPALAELPPLNGLHTHAFRWDHALAFAYWLLKDAYPDDVTVFLIEAECLDLGAELSPPVREAMHQVIEVIEKDFLAELRPPDIPAHSVEFTGDGYLRLDAELAARRFPGETAVAVQRDDELWLIPLRGPQGGGLMLKQRNAAGDRSVLVREVLEDRCPVGPRAARWDEDQGALRVTLHDLADPVPVTPDGTRDR